MELFTKVNMKMESNMVKESSHNLMEPRTKFFGITEKILLKITHYNSIANYKMKLKIIIIKVECIY
jgi:hypothetical protein